MRYWFALFLLFCDWAWDAHFGTDFFSCPMSSSLTVSQPDDDHKHNSSSRPPVQFADLASVPLLVPSNPAAFAEDSQFPHPLRSDRIYVFMTILR